MVDVLVADLIDDSMPVAILKPPETLCDGAKPPNTLCDGDIVDEVNKSEWYWLPELTSTLRRVHDQQSRNKSGRDRVVV